MRYDAPLYRPPSEARSLILQVTLGCSYNKCLFCNMYKSKRFTVRSPEEIQQHIAEGKKWDLNTPQIFLADGNVLVMDTEQLIELVHQLYREFPRLKKVTAYAGPMDLMEKSDEELSRIREAGIQMLYLGVESGSNAVLEKMCKGVDHDTMAAAGLKAKKAGFVLSCTVISGLGGKELTEDHAIETGRLMSRIDPDYLALLTLLVEPGAPLEKRIRDGSFQLLSPYEVLVETQLMIRHLDVNRCVFRSNHASNYLPLGGELNRDKERLLSQIADVIARGEDGLPADRWRSL